MAKGKKELLSSAPWRGEEDQSDKFKDAKMKVTRQPGETATMHVPPKKTKKPTDVDEDESALDPELRYSFQRNYKVSLNFSAEANLVFCFLECLIERLNFRPTGCERYSYHWNKLLSLVNWCLALLC